jgi:hypothetical protein
MQHSAAWAWRADLAAPNSSNCGSSKSPGKTRTLAMRVGIAARCESRLARPLRLEEIAVGLVASPNPIVAKACILPSHPHWARGHGRLRVPAIPVPRAHTSSVDPFFDTLARTDFLSQILPGAARECRVGCPPARTRARECYSRNRWFRPGPTRLAADLGRAPLSA